MISVEVYIYWKRKNGAISKQLFHSVRWFVNVYFLSLSFNRLLLAREHRRFANRETLMFCSVLFGDAAMRCYFRHHHRRWCHSISFSGCSGCAFLYVYMCVRVCLCVCLFVYGCMSMYQSYSSIEATTRFCWLFFQSFFFSSPSASLSYAHPRPLAHNRISCKSYKTFVFCYV